MERKDSYERTFAAEHGRIDAMFESVSRALRPGAPAALAREAFSALREALEAHVDQEDRLYYPAVQALRPDLRPLIEHLIDAHEDFRRRLGAIEASVLAGSLGAAAGAFAELLARFGAHEGEEESLLRSIDEELARAFGVEA